MILLKRIYKGISILKKIKKINSHNPYDFYFNKAHKGIFY